MTVVQMLLRKRLHAERRISIVVSIGYYYAKAAFLTSAAEASTASRSGQYLH